MRKILLSLSAFTLLAASQLFAGSGPACIRQGVAERFGVPMEDVQINENAPEPLYVDFGTKLAPGDRVRFEIHVDGALSLTEALELSTDDASLGEHKGTRVVELLGGQPARLEFLRRAVQKGTVEVVLFLGDVDLGRRTLSELEAQSTRLRDRGVQPFASRSSVESPGKLFTKSMEDCTYACEVAQDDCYYYQCGQFGSAACYGNCDMLYVSCLESCGVCQPSSSSQTTYTTVSTTATSTVECHKSITNPPYTGLQRLYNRQIKRTVTTTTINSDCSQTVTTQVTYFTTPCWTWIDYYPCYWITFEGQSC